MDRRVNARQIRNERFYGRILVKPHKLTKKDMDEFRAQIKKSESETLLITFTK